MVLLLAGAMVAGWYAARSCNDAEESAAHQAAAMPSPEPASTIAHRPWVPRSTKLRAKEKAATDAAAQDKKPASAPFDPAKAHEALSGAVRAAGSCRMRGDPSGVVEVDIRFEPSGSVKSVRIQSGEFRNTETGRCIQRRIRDTKIPEFSGASSMVTQQITVY